MNDAGLESVPVVVSSGNAVYAQLKQYDSFMPKNLLVPSGAVLAPERIGDRRQRAAVETITTAMAPLKPDFLSITAWDPGLIIVAAFRALGPDVAPERLRAWIASQKSFPAVNGNYDFPLIPNRGTDQSMVYIVHYNAATSSFNGVSQPGGEPTRH
jgi:hypothetical protein